MATPYHATVRVVPADTAPDQEQAGPIVIEVIIRVQPDAPASVPSIPVELPPLLADDEADALTKREQEVLGLVADGLSNREIAECLVLSEPTIKQYAKRIYSKLGVNSRVQAALHPQAQALRQLKRAA